MKKSIVLLLTIIGLFLGALGLTACQAKGDEEKVSTGGTQGVLYRESSDGTCVEVIGYVGTETSITIVKDYNGLPVKSIGDKAFSGKREITSLIISESVECIGNEAFYGCTSLQSILIGNSVKSIGNFAFGICTNLRNIEIPDSVVQIGEGAFDGCTGLTNAKASAFAISYVPKKNLQTVVITSGERINSFTFKSCANLTDITIPNSITSIGDCAFEKCTSLTSVNMPNSVVEIGQSVFRDCTNLTSVKIGNAITDISNFAFLNCIKLSSITIPDSVTSIGWSTFADCTALTEIILPDSVTYISSGAFYNTGYYNTKSHWENGALYIQNHLIEVKETIASAYVIKSGTKYISENAFYNCESLTEITIPDSVISICGSSFYGCNGLGNIFFNGTVEQWNAISKGSSWNDNVPATKVVCTDGEVTL